MCFTIARPQSGAAEIARARFIDSIKAFGEPRQVLFRDSRAGVAYGDFDLGWRPLFASTPSRSQRDCAAGRRIFDRVVDEVDKQLLQTVEIARNFGKLPSTR